MQEARSKFSVETEPETAILVDPSDGYLSPEGSAILHFRRPSPSASVGRINCKVLFFFFFWPCKLIISAKKKFEFFVQLLLNHMLLLYHYC